MTRLTIIRQFFRKNWTKKISCSLVSLPRVLNNRWDAFGSRSPRVIEVFSNALLPEEKKVAQEMTNHIFELICSLHKISFSTYPFVNKTCRHVLSHIHVATQQRLKGIYFCTPFGVLKSGSSNFLLNRRMLTFKFFLLVLKRIRESSKSEYIIIPLPKQQIPGITFQIHAFHLANGAMVLHLYLFHLGYTQH